MLHHNTDWRRLPELHYSSCLQIGRRYPWPLMDPALAAAFSPAAFRASGHQLVDQLADYLERSQSGADAVLPWTEPDAMLSRWPAEFESPAGQDALTSIIGEVFEQSIRLHHPRYIGHQVCAPLPVHAL